MNQNEKAGGQTGSKQNQSITDGYQNDFQIENIIDTGKFQSDLTGHLTRHRKIRRLYRCFGCEKSKSLFKMSRYPFLCRDCFKSLRDKKPVARNNFIERAKSNVGRFLRGAVAGNG